MAFSLALVADDWKQFRGPSSTGITAEQGLPTQLKDGHILWRSSLPGRGLSSPVIIGNRIFVSAAEGNEQKRLMVLCFNARTGLEEWRRTFWATGRTMCHEKTCVAAPTPVSDGNLVVALFSSNDLVCLDLEGNLKWLRGLTVDYPNASNSLGMASSPLIVDGVLVTQIENDSQSLALGIDLSDGSNIWSMARPKGANWTSPIPFERSSKPSIALQSSKGIHLVDVHTGATLSEYLDGASTIPSSVLFGSTLLSPSHGISALDLSSQQSELPMLWRSRALSPATASPMVMDNAVFVVNNAGVLTRGSLEGGRREWQLRLKGPFSASAVGFGTIQYWVNEKGLLQVVDVKPEEGAILSQLELGQTVLGTPSIANGALYLRSDNTLWKIGNPPIL
ncbi:MAG: PQQ-binding-like beta-propeller repeat protein [Verrucomicrobia bacterium]|nr:PQQ-binding-like beta-propeller repeat protein [Verrucomicrobiota bacterium]